jgi:ubiquitin carboxyl-terminal hydrolase 7
MGSEIDLYNPFFLCPLNLRLAELEKQRLYLDPVAFYDFFTNRVLVQFKPRYDDMATTVEFDLLLSKKFTYDQMASRVGERLQHDPMKLRFTNSHQGNPKNVIRRATAQGSVADMIQSSYNNAPSNVLFYELLDMSIVEIETKRNVKVTWTGAHNRDEVDSIFCASCYLKVHIPILLADTD